MCMTRTGLNLLDRSFSFGVCHDYRQGNSLLGTGTDQAYACLSLQPKQFSMLK